MKLSIPCSTLIDAVNFISSAVESRGSLPILSNLLFKVQKERVEIVGTDLEIELEYRISTETQGLEFDAEGQFTLPAKKLKQLLSVSPDKNSIVTLLSAKDDGTTYSMTFSGSRSKYTLQSLPAHDFPNLESLKTGAAKFLLPKKAFINAVASVEECIPSQDVRYYLVGLQLKAKGGDLQLNATDGHRLAQNTVTYTDVSNANEFDCIIPRKSIRCIHSLSKSEDSNLTCAVSNNHIYIKATLNGTNEAVLKSKLIDGRYPDVARVIPKHSNQTIEVNRDSLLQACSRASILANEKFRGVRLGFEKDVLTIRSSNPEQESASEELDVTVDEPLELGVNVDYFISPLKTHTSETVLLGLNTENDAMLLTSAGDENYINVLMPMRI